MQHYEPLFFENRQCNQLSNILFTFSQDNKFHLVEKPNKRDMVTTSPVVNTSIESWRFTINDKKYKKV